MLTKILTIPRKLAAALKIRKMPSCIKSQTDITFFDVKNRCDKHIFLRIILNRPNPLTKMIFHPSIKRKNTTVALDKFSGYIKHILFHHDVNKPSANNNHFHNITGFSVFPCDRYQI